MNVGILNKTPLIARQKGHYKLLPLLVSARMRISNKYLTMVIKYISWNHIVHDKYFQNPPILMGRNRCWYCNDDVSRVEKNICAGCKQVTLQITFSKVGFVHLVKQRLLFPIFFKKKSRNGDTLGPVELNVGLGNQGDQGDRREQDDQVEVSIIIFRMSESSGFQKYSISWVFQALFLCLCLCRCLCHCLCLCICVFWWFLNSFHHKLSEYVWL